LVDCRLGPQYGLAAPSPYILRPCHPPRLQHYLNAYTYRAGVSALADILSLYVHNGVSGLDSENLAV